MINVVQLLVLIKTFYSNIVNRIFGYLENILHNDIGKNAQLNEKNQFSKTVIEPSEKIQIYKNEINRKMHNYTNNQENSAGINNKFRKKETLQKKINYNFGDTEESAACDNDIETLKTSMNNSGLYHGIFYENMKCNETKIKEDEEKKFLFFESMRRDIMGRTRRSRPKTY